jgi:hypothetical protein
MEARISSHFLFLAENFIAFLGKKTAFNLKRNCAATNNNDA